MSNRASLGWFPAFVAALSLVAIQFIHFAVIDPSHPDDAVGHSHADAISHDNAPIGDHDDAHCATHSACHLLLHAVASSMQSEPSPHLGGQTHLIPSHDLTSDRSVKPPTPPPLV